MLADGTRSTAVHVLSGAVLVRIPTAWLVTHPIGTLRAEPVRGLH